MLCCYLFELFFLASDRLQRSTAPSPGSRRYTPSCPLLVGSINTRRARRWGYVGWAGWRQEPEPTHHSCMERKTFQESFKSIITDCELVQRNTIRGEMCSLWTDMDVISSKEHDIPPKIHNLACCRRREKKRNLLGSF